MTIIKENFSNTPGNRPTLVDGQIGINQADGIFYYRDNNGNLRQWNMLVPTAPSPPTYGDASQLVPNTSWVQAVVQQAQYAIVGSPPPPAAVGTLQAIARSINNDSNFYGTMQTALTGKVRWDGAQVLSAAQKNQAQMNMLGYVPANIAGDTFQNQTNFARGVIVGSNVWDNDPLSVYGAAYGRIRYLSSGVRWWSAGAINNAHFWITDESAGAVMVDISNYGGGCWLRGGLSTDGNLNVGGSNFSTDWYGARWNIWAPNNNGISFRWNQAGAGDVQVVVDNAVAGIFIYMSDGRLKQDIAPSKLDYLSVVNRIALYEYRFKDNSVPHSQKPALSDSPLYPVGFVAQELYKVAPHCVSKGNDEELGVNAPQEGMQPKPHLMWGINYPNTLAMLTGAIQQLTARVAQLEARVAALTP